MIITLGRLCHEERQQRGILGNILRELRLSVPCVAALPYTCSAVVDFAEVSPYIEVL